MIRPCFLGAGLATHLGTGITENLAALHRPPPSSQRLERRIDGRTELIPYKLLRDFPLDAPGTRLSAVLEAVVLAALREAELKPSERRRMALCLGSSSFDISVAESEYRQELSAAGDVVPLRSPSFANLAEAVRRRFGLLGEDYTFNTACTSSSNGLSYAARLIASGAVDHALVVGVELINDVTALGFLGLGLLTRSEMRPFAPTRDGLVLGEACGAVVLGRGDADRFHWRGGANLCDHYSMVASLPDGSTIAGVIDQALADASLAADAIDAVKAHGTANAANDDAEAAGMLRVFPALPPVCVLKPFLGHTLGASGLAETILFYRALEQGFLIATPGSGPSDGFGTSLIRAERPMSRGNFLLNTFGFGGNNTAVVIAKG
jgi:3-oxoacyl-[acyl-carrier-protein] synthase-1